MVVIVAFVITIGSTFAWFTLGEASTVSDMNLTINSSESILILMDNNYNLIDNSTYLNTPTNYKSVLRNIDITPVYDFLNGKIFMKPLTSTNGLSITNRAGAAASFTPNTSSPGDYIQFSVWLLSQSAEADIAISEFSVSAANDLTQKDIVVDTVRLSIDAGAASIGTNRIFGLNKDYDFQFDEGDVGYDSVTPANNQIVEAVETNLITNHHAVFHTNGLPEVGESVTEKGDATGVLNLLANTPTKVTIRIWIEGWDAQANNNLIGAVFDIAFSFIAKPQA